MPQLGSQKPGLCSLSLPLHAGFTRARTLPAWATWLPILRDNSASPRRLCRWCVCPTVCICLHPFPSTRPGRRKTFLRIDSHGSAGGCACAGSCACLHTRGVCAHCVCVQGGWDCGAACPKCAGLDVPRAWGRARAFVSRASDPTTPFSFLKFFRPLPKRKIAPSFLPLRLTPLAATVPTSFLPVTSSKPQ